MFRCVPCVCVRPPVSCYRYNSTQSVHAGKFLPVSKALHQFAHHSTVEGSKRTRSLAACLLDGRLEELGVGSRSLVGVGHGTGRLDQRQKSKASQREPIAQHQRQSTHREHDGALQRSSARAHPFLFSQTRRSGWAFEHSGLISMRDWVISLRSQRRASVFVFPPFKFADLCDKTC